MRSIRWCHFQWPWTNPNPPCFQGHTTLTLNISQTATDTAKFYSRRIGNCTQAFEWHQFQWPWVTSRSCVIRPIDDIDFKVTILFDVKKTRKWYKIESYSYNGRPVESRVWSIERRHFQWSWTTLIQFPRSHLTLSSSQTATDTVIVTIEGE